MMKLLLNEIQTNILRFSKFANHIYILTLNIIGYFFTHCMSFQTIENLEKVFQEELLEAYQLFDNRGKGFIDAASLIENMKLLGYEIDKKQVAQMIQFLDQTNKGAITKDSFIKFMSARLDYRDDPEELKMAYDFYDSNNQERINLKDLRRVAEELGEDGCICQRMLEEGDKDEDGALNLEQFLRVIKKTSYN